MRLLLSGLPASLLAVAICGAPAGAAPSPAQAPPKALTPNDIVTAAPAADWARIDPADLLVMELAPDGAGRARRVVIQLMPAPFSQGWVGNIRKLVAARWFDGIAVVRAQDNYVVQWGDPDGETPGKAKALPAELHAIREEEYVASRVEYLGHAGLGGRTERLLSTETSDSYGISGFWDGWPVARDQRYGVWPVHCYGMVGVGRGLSPDTGTGAELYVVIGQAPRQLDRNIALVGRVIEGIEHLSTLPRGTGPLGFYETAAERTPIVSVRSGTQVAGLPTFEYLRTESDSFAAYVDKRANRKDDFYIRPAGGVDVCNVPVPVRRVGAVTKPVGK
jgi:peptidylprolyl isomerase